LIIGSLRSDSRRFPVFPQAEDNTTDVVVDEVVVIMEVREQSSRDLSDGSGEDRPQQRWWSVLSFETCLWTTVRVRLWMQEMPNLSKYGMNRCKMGRVGWVACEEMM
jgi:hypothetical protein